MVDESWHGPIIRYAEFGVGLSKLGRKEERSFVRQLQLGFKVGNFCRQSFRGGHFVVVCVHFLQAKVRR